MMEEDTVYTCTQAEVLQNFYGGWLIRGSTFLMNLTLFDKDSQALLYCISAFCLNINTGFFNVFKVSGYIFSFKWL